MSQDNTKKKILDAIIGDPMIKQAQEGQKLLYDAILDRFKSNPNKFFTAGNITKHFGLFKGYKPRGGNDWLAQGFLFELEQRGLIENGKGQGYKYTTVS